MDVILMYNNRIIRCRIFADIHTSQVSNNRTLACCSCRKSRKTVSSFLNFPVSQKSSKYLPSS